MPTITPSLLYDYLQCPHKVWRDVHGPKQDLVDEDNPFLKLLWERGVRGTSTHEDRELRSVGSAAIRSTD